MGYFTLVLQAGYVRHWSICCMTEASISEAMLPKRLIRKSERLNLCMVLNVEGFLPNYSKYLQIVDHLQMQDHESGFLEETG